MSPQPRGGVRQLASTNTSWGGGEKGERSPRPRHALSQMWLVDITQPGCLSHVRGGSNSSNAAAATAETAVSVHPAATGQHKES